MLTLHAMNAIPAQLLVSDTNVLSAQTLTYAKDVKQLQLTIIHSSKSSTQDTLQLKFSPSLTTKRMLLKSMGKRSHYLDFKMDLISSEDCLGKIEDLKNADKHSTDAEITLESSQKT
jgi:hypothetical protein